MAKNKHEHSHEQSSLILEWALKYFFFHEERVKKKCQGSQEAVNKIELSSGLNVCSTKAWLAIFSSWRSNGGQYSEKSGKYH